MKKLYALAATVVTTATVIGTGSMTAMAAGYQVYTIPMGSGSGAEISQILKENGIQLSDLTGSGCEKGHLIIWDGNGLQCADSSCDELPNWNLGSGNGGNLNWGQLPGNGNNSGGTVNGGSNNGGGSQQLPTDQNEFAARVAQLVNEERAKAGLSALKMDAQVSAAATVRAGELPASFSHTRPNGSSFSSALTEKGIQFRASGENIAYGQQTPEQVMNGWMNSSGHRANILNPDFTTIGVGHIKNGSGTSYWAQLFVK